MEHNKIFIGLWLMLYGSFFALAQEQEPDDLGTQEVTVVKSYSPSLKNVFKIRTNPSIDDSLIQKKQKLEFTFEPIPVVSTFVPNKASPLKLQRQEGSYYYNSFVSGGFGNQSHPQFVFSSSVPLDRSQSIGFKFYNSSVGSIPNTLLESDQKRISLDLMHQYKQNHMRVDSDVRFDRQGHNFFGLYDLNWENIPSFRSEIVDPSQKLNYLSIRSRWQWYESIFTKMDFNTHITTDSFDSTEHMVKINTQLRIPFLNQYVELTPSVEWVNTNFARAYFTEEGLSHQNGFGQLDLQFLSIGKRLNLRIGASGFIDLGNAEATSKFFVYPKAEIHYTLAQPNLVPYFKYYGHYDLNSFTSFSLKNPYVAPTLEIKPTEVNHHGELGIQSHLDSGFSFKLNALYSQSDNFPLFKRLPYDHYNQDIAYRLSNAYDVIYDRVEQMGIITQIAIRLSEYNKIRLETGFFEYKRAGGEKAFNLPSLTIDLDANFRWGRKLYFHFGGHFMGERDSVRNLIVPLAEDSAGNFETFESVGSVFSVSSSISWKINPQWDLFYENYLNLGDNTSQWAYYQNQSQLHLVGIRYKFNLNLW